MFSLRMYWKYPGICFLTESFDSGRAAEKWIFLTRKPAVIVGVAVVSVELWRDWSQVLHQEEDEAQSRHLGFFCCHLERSEAVLITFLCSVSGGKNNPKRQHLSQITSSTATFTCVSVAVSSDLYQSSSTFPSKRAVFLPCTLLPQSLALMQLLLNQYRRFSPAHIGRTHLAVELLVRLEVPTLCLHHVCADEKDRADLYLNTDCSVEHGKLYQMWMGQTNLFTAPRNLSTLGGFPLGSPRPDLRLSARTNAGLGRGGAPRELSCHQLLPRLAFTWT